MPPGNRNTRKSGDWQLRREAGAVEAGGLVGGGADVEVVGEGAGGDVIRD
jgi:hypothetical protein